MKLRKGRLLRAALLAGSLLGLTAMLSPTIASSVAPSISAYNEPGAYGVARHYWMPSVATVSSGGELKFVNPYTETYHGLKFTGGSAGEAPSCTGIPPEAEGPNGAFNWEGQCKFGKPGTYTFVCTVHAEMTGTITVPGTPAVTTEPSAEVRQDHATLEGAVKPEGNATQYRFEYGTASVSEHTTTTIGLGATDFGKHIVSAQATGLMPGTEYQFQLVAIYAEGKTTVIGGKQTFVTPLPTAPTATTAQAGALTETEATLEGTVDPNDGEATEYSFEYGTTPAYGQRTVTVNLPTDTVNHQVSVPVSGLVSGTEYHFRLVAKNKLGPAAGIDQTFKTTSPSAPPSKSPIPATTPSPLPPPPPPPTGPLVKPAPPGPPLVGSPSLPATQRGSAVRGSLQVSQSGAGGTLEVDLLAKGKVLVKTRPPRSSSVRVGRLSRVSLSAGKLSFSVALNAAARQTLKRKRRLVLTVEITLVPIQGRTITVTRSVTLRA